jgi:hypothetical protein
MPNGTSYAGLGLADEARPGQRRPFVKTRGGRAREHRRRVPPFVFRHESVVRLGRCEFRSETEGVHDSSYRPGNLEDFDRLYRESYPRVLRTLIGMLGDRAAAEDCTQEAFVKACRAWATWRADGLIASRRVDPCAPIEQRQSPGEHVERLGEGLVEMGVRAAGAGQHVPLEEAEPLSRSVAQFAGVSPGTNRSVAASRPAPRSRRDPELPRPRPPWL